MPFFKALFVCIVVHILFDIVWHLLQVLNIDFISIELFNYLKGIFCFFAVMSVLGG